MTDKPRNVCSNCGARDDALKGLGPLCIIPDTTYEQLRALFLQQVDDYRCRICRRSMGLRPTVIVVINEKQKYLCCLGDRAFAVPEELRKNFLDGLESEGAQVEAFATLDELRAAYAKRIASMVEHIIQGIDAASRDDCKGLFAGGWRDFPSNHFVAAVLILSTPLPGIDMDFHDGSTAEGVFDNIVAFQVKVWLSFCGSWSSELEKGRTLEGDLSRYLAPDTMLHKAADEFLRVTENPEHWTPVGRFCLEAVRASLCVWRNKPNHRLREWADLFVEQEVARRVLGEQSPPHLVAMEISAERARDTIPYEELFDACAQQVGKHWSKVLPQLQEIGQKVGYPHLAAQLVASVRPLPKEGQMVSVDKLLEGLRATYKGGSPEPLLMAASNLLVVLGGCCA